MPPICCEPQLRDNCKYPYPPPPVRIITKMAESSCFDRQKKLGRKLSVLVAPRLCIYSSMSIEADQNRCRMYQSNAAVMGLRLCQPCKLVDCFCNLLSEYQVTYRYHKTQNTKQPDIFLCMYGRTYLLNTYESGAYTCSVRFVFSHIIDACDYFQRAYRCLPVSDDEENVTGTSPWHENTHCCLAPTDYFVYLFPISVKQLQHVLKTKINW